MGTVVNRALPSLHGWLLEITLTVPFKGLLFLKGLKVLCKKLEKKLSNPPTT